MVLYIHIYPGLLQFLRDNRFRVFPRGEKHDWKRIKAIILVEDLSSTGWEGEEERGRGGMDENGIKLTLT